MFIIIFPNENKIQIIYSVKNRGKKMIFDELEKMIIYLIFATMGIVLFFIIYFLIPKPVKR